MAQVLPFTRVSIEPTLVLAISAYDKTVADISNTPQVVREVIPKQIIQFIAEGERDPNVLYERAIALPVFRPPANAIGFG